jgi:hypothetical protein
LFILPLYIIVVSAFEGACDGVVHQCAIEALLVFACSLYLLVGLDSTTVG